MDLEQAIRDSSARIMVDFQRGRLMSATGERISSSRQAHAMCAQAAEAIKVKATQKPPPPPPKKKGK